MQKIRRIITSLLGVILVGILFIGGTLFLEKQLAVPLTLAEHEWNEAQVAEGERRLNAYRNAKVDVAKTSQGNVYVVDGRPYTERDRPEWLSNDGVTVSLTKRDRREIIERGIIQMPTWVLGIDDMKVQRFNLALKGIWICSIVGMLLGFMSITKDYRELMTPLILGGMFLTLVALAIGNLTFGVIFALLIFTPAFLTRFLVLRPFKPI